MSMQKQQFFRSCRMDLGTLMLWMQMLDRRRSNRY